MAATQEKHAMHIKMPWTEKTNNAFKYEPQTKECNINSMSEICHHGYIVKVKDSAKVLS